MAAPNHTADDCLATHLQVVDYFNGNLNATARRAFEERLLDCTNCLMIFAQYVEKHNLWDRLQPSTRERASRAQPEDEEESVQE